MDEDFMNEIEFSDGERAASYLAAAARSTPRKTWEALHGFCWKCGAALTKDEDTLCRFGAHRNVQPND